MFLHATSFFFQAPTLIDKKVVRPEGGTAGYFRQHLWTTKKIILNLQSRARTAGYNSRPSLTSYVLPLQGPYRSTPPMQYVTVDFSESWRTLVRQGEFHCTRCFLRYSVALHSTCSSTVLSGLHAHRRTGLHGYCAAQATEV